MSRRVDVYFSLISPWAHLGHEPFLAVAAKHQLEVAWKPVPLLALFSETGGAPLAKRPIQRQRYRDVELMRWAARRQRPINVAPKHWPFDPKLADRATIALIAMGKNPAGFLGAGFRGVWEDELDLGSRDVLARLIADQGFDAEATLATAEGGDVAAAYEANHAEALGADVFGSPCYVLDGEAFWGQDRLDLLDDALTSGRKAYRSTR